MTTRLAGVEAVRAAAPDVERDPEAYRIDGRTPALALQPTDRAAAARILEAAAQSGMVVVPQGARTALRLGRPLEGYDVALDTTGLDQVVAYEPADLTITVEAGATLAAVQRTLADHGQYLPVDAPPGDEVTVGGLLATARSGAWRYHLPNQRELILGATVALPDGTLATSGGRVVKNVSGYDLHRLHTGALGALGVIVEASFKVSPLPDVTRTIALASATLAAAEAAAFDAWNRGLATRAIAVLAPAAASAAGLEALPHALIEVAGSTPAVERSLRDLDVVARDAASRAVETGDEVWARLRRLAGGSDIDVILRLGVPPASIRVALEATSRLGHVEAWAHLASGSVTVRAPAIEENEIHRLRTVTHSLGGYLAIEAAPTALRSAVDPFAAGDLALTRALREQFDPARTINRGRWGAGL